MTGREQREENVRACLDALLDAIPAAILARMPTSPEQRQIMNDTILGVILGMTEEGPDSPAFQMVLASMKARADSAFAGGFARGFAYEMAMNAPDSDKEPDA